MGRWHRLGASEETGPSESLAGAARGQRCRGVPVADALTGPVPGAARPVLSQLSVPFLGAGSRELQPPPPPSEEPRGHSQEPAVPRALHLCLCPSESLLGQVVGGPLGTALPVPTAGELAPWGCAGSSGLFPPPPGPSRAPGAPPGRGLSGQSVCPGQRRLLQEGRVSWRGWADPWGGRLL